jgi:hypothetical protein
LPNPKGVNQLSPHGYGDVQKQTQLKRSAPISGAPLVAGALNAAQQNQRRAVRSAPAATETGAVGVGEPQPPPQPTPQAIIGQVFAAAASYPGASPLIKQIAAQANP